MDSTSSAWGCVLMFSGYCYIEEKGGKSRRAEGSHGNFIFFDLSA